MPKKYLLTLYTRSPLHVGCGSSVDVVDLPVRRERITNYPLIPNSSLKGVLLQEARELWGDGRKRLPPEKARALFGTGEEEVVEGEKKHVAWSGCIQIMEGKLLAFPLRSLCGGYGWVTCPTALLRFQRDTGKLEGLPIPSPAVDTVVTGTDSALRLPDGKTVVFEEYALGVAGREAEVDALAVAMMGLTDDPVWSGHLAARLAVVSDENFQHFVTTCTEVVTRVAISPETRTVAGGDKGGALWNQENVPCETLFYSVLTVFRSLDGKGTSEADMDRDFTDLVKESLILQIGGDATTGHGICETRRIMLP